MSDIISIGHSTVDLYMDVPAAHLHEVHADQKEMCLLWGAKYEAESLHMSVGGNAHNVTQGLRKLGIDASLFSALGNDMFGEFAREFLSKSGIKHDNLETVSRTNVSTVLNVKGDRTLLAYHSDEPCIVEPSTIQLHNPQWIFITSFAYNTQQELHKTVIEYKKNYPSVRLAYNPGGKELRTPNSYTELMQHTDLLFVNLDEARLVLGTEDLKITEVLSKLKMKTNGAVVITNGEEGAYGFDGEKMYHQKPFPTELVEKTGAGDAFTSGVLGALFLSETFEQALRWGAAQSAAAIKVAGSSEGLLDKVNLLQTLDKLKELHPETI